MDAYSENHKKHMNTLSEQNSGFVLKLQNVVYIVTTFIFKGWL
jgi:hypothetical protein